ncbi:hypothetical protein B0J13DRAFT_665853 [Dactylonectria estremocensis]|uniref:Uncharacterized protein n=1 Tax=Dactylonectria estremocensis TaxID=1079267 RepID=A0A9P9J6V1_9HYPO|nr:hypothetical protein B0J13DRAFT_665853 [Dactylonectria estremocensis]
MLPQKKPTDIRQCVSLPGQLIKDSLVIAETKLAEEKLAEGKLVEKCEIKDTTDKLKDEDYVLNFLVKNTNVGQNTKELYSTLSQVIHQFSNGKFTVNPLNFSPGDARLLAALVPGSSVTEGMTEIS